MPMIILCQLIRFPDRKRIAVSHRNSCVFAPPLPTSSFALVLVLGSRRYHGLASPMTQPCSLPYSASHRTSLPGIARQRQELSGRNFPRRSSPPAWLAHKRTKRVSYQRCVARRVPFFASMRQCLIYSVSRSCARSFSLPFSLLRQWLSLQLISSWVLPSF